MTQDISSLSDRVDDHAKEIVDLRHELGELASDLSLVSRNQEQADSQLSQIWQTLTTIRTEAATQNGERKSENQSIAMEVKKLSEKISEYKGAQARDTEIRENQLIQEKLREARWKHIAAVLCACCTLLSLIGIVWSSMSSESLGDLVRSHVHIIVQAPHIP